MARSTALYAHIRELSVLYSCDGVRLHLLGCRVHDEIVAVRQLEAQSPNEGVSYRLAQCDDYDRPVYSYTSNAVGCLEGHGGERSDYQLTDKFRSGIFIIIVFVPFRGISRSEWLKSSFRAFV